MEIKQKMNRLDARKIFYILTVLMVGVSTGFVMDGEKYQPIPEDQPVIASAYNSTAGEYVLEIGRLDTGYTVCTQEKSFKKVESEDVFGGFTCTHLEDSVHPLIQSTRERVNQEKGGNSSE